MIKRKTNRRLRRKNFKSRAAHYTLHPTKGFRRMRQQQRIAVDEGEAKYNWFLQAGRRNVMDDIAVKS